YDLEGEEQYRFAAEDIKANLRMLSMFTNGQGRYLFGVRSGTETQYYAWDESEQLFELVLEEDSIIAASAAEPAINGSIKVLCHTEGNLYYAYVLSGNTIDLLTVNPVSNIYAGEGSYSYSRNIDVEDDV